MHIYEDLISYNNKIDCNNSQSADKNEQLGLLRWQYVWTVAFSCFLFFNFCTSAMISRRNIPSVDPGNYSLSKWVYTVAKLFGYWPFPTNMVHRDSSQSAQINIRNGLWTLIVALFHSTIIMVETSEDELKSLELGITDIRLARTTSCVLVGILILSIILNIYNRETLKHMDIINMNFDQKVIAYHTNRRYDYHKRDWFILYIFIFADELFGIHFEIQSIQKTFPIRYGRFGSDHTIHKSVFIDRFDVRIW